jgi:hypothetical protein
MSSCVFSVHNTARFSRATSGFAFLIRVHKVIHSSIEDSFCYLRPVISLGQQGFFPRI